MKISKVINRLFALMLLTTLFVACQDQAAQKEVKPLPELDSPSAVIYLCEPMIVFPRVTRDEYYDRERRDCAFSPGNYCVNPNTGGVRLICHKIPLKQVPEPCFKPFCGKIPLIPRKLFEYPEIDGTVIFPYEDYLVIQRIKKFEEEEKTRFTKIGKPLDIGSKLAQELKLPGHIIKPGEYLTIPSLEEGMESVFVHKEYLSK